MKRFYNYSTECDIKKLNTFSNSEVSLLIKAKELRQEFIWKF